MNNGPNLRDIARHNKVSVSTVSRALRNHPAIPQQTRDRIVASAKELGYRPNPLIGALMSNVRARKSISIANLACLYKEESDSSFSATLKQFLIGVDLGAERLGYHMSHFRLADYEAKPSTLFRIWKARGIRGVILFNYRPKKELDVPWNDYSWVVSGSVTHAPDLPRVGNEIYQIVKMAIKETASRGYSRPALVVPLKGGSRHGFRWAGAFSANLLKYGACDESPLIYSGDWNSGNFQSWIKKVKPDVALSMSDEVYHWLQGCGIRIPTDLGFVHLVANSSKIDAVAGVRQDFIQTGVKAVACLDSQLRNNEVGVPQIVTTTTLTGIWQSGQTLASQIRF